MSSPPSKTVYASSAFSSPLLTIDDIINMRADYDSDMRLMEELPARLKQKKKLLEAAMFFLPSGFDLDAFISLRSDSSSDAVSSTDLQRPGLELVMQASVEEVEEEDEKDEDGGGRRTWIGSLMTLLENANGGVTHQDALAELKATPLGENSSNGDKGFYNAVSRLEKRGKLQKYGGLLYATKVIEAMRSRGEPLPDMAAELRRRGGSSSAVVELLQKNPQGLDASQLREELVKLPGTTASLKKHPHFIYNVLGTLMGHGEIEKTENGLYRIKANV